MKKVFLIFSLVFGILSKERISYIPDQFLFLEINFSNLVKRDPEK